MNVKQNRVRANENRKVFLTPFFGRKDIWWSILGFTFFVGAGLMTVVEADEKLIRERIAKALPVIERSAKISAEKRRCFTCHHQALPVFVAIEAKKLGFSIDEANLKRQITHTVAHLERGLESYRQGTGQGGKADTAGMALLTLRAANHPPSEITDAVAEFLLGWNPKSAHWRPQSDRPPSEGSFFTSTYLALGGLDAYARKKISKEVETRKTAAIGWLEKTDPEETEDAVFRLRALHMLGLETKNAGEELLALQRTDGGWGQLPDFESEAYSTGSALVALHEAKILAADSADFRAGISFLMKNQFEDGTWHVKSRSEPIQRHYESGFPHGKDQFISCSGTCWAVLALIRSLPVETEE